MTGHTDDRIWRAAREEQQLWITQDLDFSDTRRFAPGTHALATAIEAVAPEIDDWGRCFVVLTDTKIRVKRP
ncbi:hypothetical protein CKO22_04670 [Thiococcus pfennigii]|nr:hypothetical protein [Thiococcus pfennigii]